MRPGPAFILRITLVDTRPPVWRQVIVPADITLARLHTVLQTAVGWSGSGPHYFTDQSGQFYATDHSGGAVKDARRFKLQKILRVPRDRMRYVYNGASLWEHSVALESVVTPAERLRRAECLAGARQCPPEDCAGATDFAALLKRLSGRRRSKSQAVGYCRGWVDGPFQPEAFDHLVVNSSLKCVRV